MVRVISSLCSPVAHSAECTRNCVLGSKGVSNHRTWYGKYHHTLVCQVWEATAAMTSAARTPAPANVSLFKPNTQETPTSKRRRVCVVVCVVDCELVCGVACGVVCVEECGGRRERVYPSNIPHKPPGEK